MHHEFIALKNVENRAIKMVMAKKLMRMAKNMETHGLLVKLYIDMIFRIINLKYIKFEC